jgi:hypothetical protein
MRTTSSHAALAAVLALSGCAFGNRTARLAYPWPGEPAAPAAVPANAPEVALQPVKDLRPEPRNVVGWVRNGFGMHTADVLTPDDVAAWVSSALRHELERAGVKVVGETQGAATPVLGAELSRVHCNAYMSYEGEVALRAWIRVGEAYPLNQLYVGAGSAGVNMAATGEGYAECLARSLQDAARRVAADAARLLGVPPPPPAAPPAGTPRS